jgi:hypothetical protein
MIGYAFKGFGWFLCGVIVAPACYLVSSQVAAERARVETVANAIAEVHKDIRTLETEFNTRGNLAQLERWNGDVLALQAPQSGQFLSGDSALASLRPLEGMASLQQAAMVVPAGVPAPVAAPAIEPSEVQTASVETMPIARPVREAMAEGKGQAIAMLDSKLLSGSTLNDLVKGARAEAMTIR